MLIATTVQACAPLINCAEGRNLSHVKQQIKNVKIEDIIITPFVDETRQEIFQRRGMLVRKNGARGTVVMCHGYLGCKRDTIALKHLFPQYNILVFDFRAHGEDREGQVSTIGRDEALDVLAAVEFVKHDKLMRDKPIIAYGFSMGAVSAIQAQAMEGNLFDAMILDCPYDSTDEGMSRGLDEKMKFTLFGKTFMIPGKQFILDHMYDDFAQMFTDILFQAITKFDSNKVATKFVQVRPIDSVKKITVPCYFIHCESDSKIPVSAIEEMYKNKPGFKRLWITPGKWHFGSYQNDPELYWYKINKFLTKLHERDITTRVQEKVCDERTQVTVSVVE